MTITTTNNLGTALFAAATGALFAYLFRMLGRFGVGIGIGIFNLVTFWITLLVFAFIFFVWTTFAVLMDIISGEAFLLSFFIGAFCVFAWGPLKRLVRRSREDPTPA